MLYRSVNSCVYLHFAHCHTKTYPSAATYVYPVMWRIYDICSHIDTCNVSTQRSIVERYRLYSFLVYYKYLLLWLVVDFQASFRD